jgi:hypothetical protein
MMIAAVVVALVLAGAVAVVRVVARCTPGIDCGYVSGYDSPQTLVLVDVDGQTLRAGWQGCAQYAALQAVERPGEVVLRVHWRSPRTYECGQLVDDFAAPSLNLQVRLSAPLAGRRLVGPDGAALPWLDEATMLRFTPPVQMSGLAGLRYRGPAYWRRNPQPPQSAQLFPDRLFPAAKCLDTETNGVPIELRLDECAYAGAGAPAPGPTPGAGTPAALPGTPTAVRGQAGRVVDHPRGTGSLSWDDNPPWRALWWTEGHEIVVLISQRTAPVQPALLSVSQLVAVADELWCVRPAACR